MKKAIIIGLLVLILIQLCSCTVFKNPIDKNSNFSSSLEETENYIRNEDWVHAKSSLIASDKNWKKIKPWLQIDIDHDYVNDIEDNMIRLRAYINTQEKPDSLAAILLIKETWENIGVY